MSSPIFDSTFGTGRFRYEEATKSPEPQDVRQALELQLLDLVELARDTRSDKGGEAKWVHPCGALVKEFAKRIAALAQSDAGPPPLRYSDKVERADDGTETRRLELAQSDADASGRIEALEQIIDNCECNDIPTSNHRMALRFIRDVARKALRTRAADRSVHGELIPDCPTEGVAARQGNGG